MRLCCGSHPPRARSARGRLDAEGFDYRGQVRLHHEEQRAGRAARPSFAAFPFLQRTEADSKGFSELLLCHARAQAYSSDVLCADFHGIDTAAESARGDVFAYFLKALHQSFEISFFHRRIFPAESLMSFTIRISALRCAGDTSALVFFANRYNAYTGRFSPK